MDTYLVSIRLKISENMTSNLVEAFHWEQLLSGIIYNYSSEEESAVLAE